MLSVHELRRFSSWLDPLEPCRVATGRRCLPLVKDAVVEKKKLDSLSMWMQRINLHCMAFFELI